MSDQPIGIGREIRPERGHDRGEYTGNAIHMESEYSSIHAADKSRTAPHSGAASRFPP